MSGYDDLVAMVTTIAAEFPGVTVTMRPLRGSRDDDDQLIIERTIGDDVHMLRIPASSIDGGRTFAWGHLPIEPGNPRAEGKWFGDDAFVRAAIRRFIFDLADWKTVSESCLEHVRARTR